MVEPALMMRPRWPQLQGHSVQAALFTLGLHLLLLAALLLANWAPLPPAAPEPVSISVRLAQLPPPSAPAVPPPLVLQAPAMPAAIAEAPAKPRSIRPQPDHAALARQRIAQQQAQQQRQQQAQQQARDQQLRQQAEAAERQRQQAAAAERARQLAAAASQQYLPLTKQPPAYPQRALDKGIEGDCTVSYSVNAEGRVENPVASGQCHPLFVRPSLAAARAFRYQPRVIDGRAVAVPNVSNTFEYRIE